MNSSALVRSRKYNKERGQLMSHSRKNSLLFDMRAHSSRQGRQYAMNQFPVRDLHLVWSIWPTGFSFCISVLCNCENLLQNGNFIQQSSLLSFQVWFRKMSKLSKISSFKNCQYIYILESIE